MKVFSKNFSIAASATAAVKPPLGGDGKPLSETILVQHPAGTVLDLPEDIAAELVRRGQAVEFDKKQHEEKDGKVEFVSTQQVAASLPEGHTHPVVVRQDGTLNDGTPLTTVGEAPVILRDTKNDAEVDAASKAALDLAAAAHKPAHPAVKK